MKSNLRLRHRREATRSRQLLLFWPPEGTPLGTSRRAKRYTIYEVSASFISFGHAPVLPLNSSPVTRIGEKCHCHMASDGDTIPLGWTRTSLSWPLRGPRHGKVYRRAKGYLEMREHYANPDHRRILWLPLNGSFYPHYLDAPHCQCETCKRKRGLIGFRLGG